MTKDIEHEALNLLKDYDYQWDPSLFSFRRRRRVGQESTEHYLANPVLISYEELSDHGLTRTQSSQLDTDRKIEALNWLRGRIKEQGR